MANTIKVLFWLHLSKRNSKGLVPLALRLSFQKKRADKLTGFYIDEKNWNKGKQHLKGAGSEAQKINQWIDATRAKINSLFRTSSEKGDVHLPSIIDELYAKVKIEPTLLNVIAEHNERLRLRVGKDYSLSTYEKYLFTYDKVAAFIINKLKKKDVLLKDVSLKFIMEFDHYLRVHDSNQHNTAVKYCINLKRILNVAVMRGLISSNPLNAFKTVYRDTEQVYLSEQEVLAMEQLSLAKQYHLLVRDLFLFQCYSGLAYTDLTSFTSKNIMLDGGGTYWLIKARQKSGIICNIPLLPRALEILQKYQHQAVNGQSFFPSYSIQKYNKYIGEVGNMAKIQKKLSSHVGRRTFGNLGLSKGLSLNVISKILGHSNTIITQRIYAITNQNIIKQEMTKWK